MPTDPARFEQRFQNELDRLGKADIDEADRRAIRRFITAKDSTCAISSLMQYAKQLRVTARRANAPLAEMDLDDARDMFFEFSHSNEYGRGDGGMSESTLQNTQRICKMFWQFLDRDWADDIDVASVSPKTVDAEDMLGPEDIQDLTSAARYARDVALIEFFADTGARRTLVASLRVKDVDLDGERATYQPNADALGLKGADIKPYPIIDSRAVLRNYLRTSHPRPDEPDAALFHKMQGYDDDVEEDSGGLSASGLRSLLKSITARAGVEKPTNPHNFRHSAITRMIREGYTRTQIEHRVHWSLDTAMWETYVHVTAEELNDDIFGTAGVGDPTEESNPVRKTCGNCHEVLAPHHAHCPNCGEPATPEARRQRDEKQDDVVDALVEATDAQGRRRLRVLLDEIDDDPRLAVDDGHASSPSSESS